MSSRTSTDKAKRYLYRAEESNDEDRRLDALIGIGYAVIAVAEALREKG